MHPSEIFNSFSHSPRVCRRFTLGSIHSELHSRYCYVHLMCTECNCEGCKVKKSRGWKPKTGKNATTSSTVLIHFKIRKPLSLLLPQKFPVTLVVKHNFGPECTRKKAVKQQHRKKCAVKYVLSATLGLRHHPQPPNSDFGVNFPLSPRLCVGLTYPSN